MAGKAFAPSGRHPRKLHSLCTSAEGGLAEIVGWQAVVQLSTEMSIMASVLMSGDDWVSRFMVQ